MITEEDLEANLLCLGVVEVLFDSQRHLTCRPNSKIHEVAKVLGIKRCWWHKDHYDIPKRKITQFQMLAAESEFFKQVSPKEILKIVRPK